MRSSIGLNGSRWACEKTGPDCGPCHSPVRHGFAGGRFQHVSGFLSQPFVCTGPDEQVLERQEWSRSYGATHRNSAARQLAAYIRLCAAPGSKSLDLGTARLAWEFARWLTSDEADDGRHSPHLRRGPETFFSHPPASWVASILCVNRCLGRRRRAERLWPAFTAVDDSRVRNITTGSRLRDGHTSAAGDDPGDARSRLNFSACLAAFDHLAFHSAGSGCGHYFVVGCQSSIRGLRPQDALRTSLRRSGCGVRPDGVDGIFRHDRLPRRSLERGKFEIGTVSNCEQNSETLNGIIHELWIRELSCHRFREFARHSRRHL